MTEIIYKWPKLKKIYATEEYLDAKNKNIGIFIINFTANSINLENDTVFDIYLIPIFSSNFTENDIIKVGRFFAETMTLEYTIPKKYSVLEIE
ncbi:MAG: hypothetical protein KAI67_04200 [Candidatus Pacebacteria bacterium]|nr:hypothetical protein [Candidatus Paceibacterota bacterium]